MPGADPRQLIFSLQETSPHPCWLRPILEPWSGSVPIFTALLGSSCLHDAAKIGTDGILLDAKPIHGRQTLPVLVFVILLLFPFFFFVLFFPLVSLELVIGFETGIAFRTGPGAYVGTCPGIATDA